MPSTLYIIFEHLGIELTTNGILPTKLHAIYHSPGDNQIFLDDLTDLTTESALTDCNHFFIGDFNLHWNDPNSKMVKDLTANLDLHDLHQIRKGPTHNKGSTVDAVISKHGLASLNSITPPGLV